jgi:hypothetical protein
MATLAWIDMHVIDVPQQGGFINDPMKPKTVFTAVPDSFLRCRVK